MASIFSASFAMPLLDCLFEDDQSATHCAYAFEPEVYGSIDNVYVVCIADNAAVTEIRAGLVMKSDLVHTDAIFPYAVTAAIAASPILSGRIEPQRCTFFPARIKVDGPPLTESEMLQLLARHYSQFSFKSVN